MVHLLLDIKFKGTNECFGIVPLTVYCGHDPTEKGKSGFDAKVISYVYT